MKALWLALAVLALPAAAHAQDACATHCNQQHSECLRACQGDPRDTGKPGQKERMAGCLRQCQATAAPCRAQCRGPQGAPGPGPTPLPR